MDEKLQARRRVVVTGLGAITPLGQSVATFWEALSHGKSGIGPITLFDPTDYPCRVAGEVKDWQPNAFIDRKAARRMARFAQFMVAAARQAFEDAGLNFAEEDATRIGVLIGNGGGGYPDIQEAVRTIVDRGGMRLDPLYFPRTLANMAAAQVAMQFGARGYNGTISTACAAGTQAVGEAAMVIRSGRADAVLTGGCEAGISELGLAGFSVMRALQTNSNDAPEKASRPFDATREGFVPSEGAGALLLESEQHALARGARIYAEVLGFGCSSDAFHVAAPAENGEGAARAMSEALNDAGVTPEQIDYINAHATGTPSGDSAETAAIKHVFGEQAYEVAISATKSMIGHGLGASGGIEAVATVKTIESGVIHPTINLWNRDPACDLDYVANEARQRPVKLALKNSFGFGGQNSCLVLGRYIEG